MPVNRENKIQVGTTITNAENETIEDLADRFGVSKSNYIRKAIKEMTYKLIEEVRVLS